MFFFKRLKFFAVAVAVLSCVVLPLRSRVVGCEARSPIPLAR